MLPAWLELMIICSPYDENFVIAGCTNGKTYVWDIRQPRPEDHLYSLVHGHPLMELGDGDEASIEHLDTGIRFCSWGHDRRKLYTGSSDGVVKSWDLYRAPEDVFIKDVVQLNSGVMSGACSPDYTSLLLGEVNGTINVLETGQSNRSIKDMDSFNFIASQLDEPTDGNPHNDGDDDSGIAIANRLLQTDQLTIRPMGGLPIRQAVQGKEYAGPYDSAADAPALRREAHRFQTTMSGGSSETTPTNSCTIPACAATNTLVPEEAGDSGRSADRIPGALRSLRLPTATTAVAPGLIKCTRCGIRPARMRTESDAKGSEEASDADENDSRAEKPRLCERCSFACLRCGKEAWMLDDAVERIFCPHCCSTWRADVLGYRLLHTNDAEGSDNHDHGSDDSDNSDDSDDHASPRKSIASVVRSKKSRASSSSTQQSSPVKGEKKHGSKKPKGVTAALEPVWVKRARKCRVGENPLERAQRRGHGYMGEDCFEEWLHERWEDRAESPL